MNVLQDWAAAWRVPPAALADLRSRLGMLDTVPPAQAGASESAVQSRVRLAVARDGGRVWRNNVGAGYAEDGSFMRWGLANDSAQVNKVIKSGDLIGIEPRVIQPTDVGTLMGQFVSYEIKREGWKYTGTEREVAQANWAAHVVSLGGRACFISHEGQRA